MRKKIRLGLLASLFATLASTTWWVTAQTAEPAPAPRGSVATVPGMPPVIDRDNLYSEIGARPSLGRGAGRPGARLRAQSQRQQRLGDRPRDA